MLHFAVAGAPHETPKPGGTLLGLQYAHSLGITAMELEWVQRVPTNLTHLDEIKQVALANTQFLTVHAPYFINLNSRDPEKLHASKLRIWQSLEMAERISAHSVCIHPAFYTGFSAGDTFSFVYKALADVFSKKEELFPTVNVALETMGKHTQFGTLEEVLQLSKDFQCYPTIDFAHLHARANGAINTLAEFHTIFDVYAQYLGESALSTMHIHYSGIEYTSKGERRHLPFADSDANVTAFVTALHERNVGGTVICESPILEQDTLFLKQLYEAL